MDVYGLLEVRPTPPPAPPPKPAELIVGGVGALRAPDRGTTGVRGEWDASGRPANPVAMSERGAPGASPGNGDPSTGSPLPGGPATAVSRTTSPGSPDVPAALNEAGAHEALLRHLERAAGPQPIPQERTRAQ